MRAWTLEKIDAMDATYQEARDGMQDRWNRLSVLRLLGVLLIIAAVIAWVAENLGWMPMEIIVLVAVTVWIFRRSEALGREIRLMDARRAILGDYRARIRRETSKLPPFEIPDDLRNAYPDEVLAIWEDLELTGDAGILRLLCVAEAPGSGRRILRRLITIPELRPDDAIAQDDRDYRAAVQDLLTHPDMAIELQAYGRSGRHKHYGDPSEARGKVREVTPTLWQDRHALSRILHNEHEAPPKWWRTLSARVLPIMNGVLAIYLLFLRNLWETPPIPTRYPALVLVTSALVNWAIHLRWRKRLEATLQPFDAALTPLNQARSVLAFFEAETLRREEAGERAIPDALTRFHAPHAADEACRGLDRLIQRSLFRRQGILHWIGQVLLGWDMALLDAVGAWRSRYAAPMEDWLNLWSIWDTAATMTTLARIDEAVCLAEPATDQATFVNGRAIRHPLIPETEAVGNDLKVGAETLIITGSNMSGKSTFLRAVGVAMTFAQAEAVVPATSFSYTPCRILSSIRTKDRLAAGVSSFYAEIRRIRAMREWVEKGGKHLLLIDEIFHGTNAADRQYGAEQVLRKLSGPENLLMVTTHDYALCDLVDDPALCASNLHFREYYEDGKMLFDYRLRPGRSETTNARYLLRLAGLTDDDV